MKKWIVLFITLLFASMIFWSCSEDDSSTTEPEPENILPTCTIISPIDSAEYFIGDTILVQVSADDEDGSIEEVRFYLDGLGIGWDNSPLYAFTIITSSLTDSIHTIKAIAEDNEGDLAESQIEIILNKIPNNPPIIDSLVANPSPIEINQITSLTCFASDVDGDVLAYSWSNTGGTITGSGSNVTWTAPSAIGTYSIICTVSDGNFLRVDSVVINVTETPNHSPVISSITATNLSVEQGGTSLLTCNASDADGDDLIYSWSVTGGSIIGTSSSETWTAPSTVGNYTIICVVSDGKNTDAESVNILVYKPMEMVSVSGGTFFMGDRFNEGLSDELPIHSVIVSDFKIGVKEVTQSEWATYMLADFYDYGTGENYPTYGVGWYEILVYCNKRSIAEERIPCYTIENSTNPDNWGHIPTSLTTTWDSVTCNWSANGYRLPTEAEWEYAARGGIHNEDNYHFSGGDSLDVVAWFGDNSGDNAQPVGVKTQNQLGIFDMSGNAWEWCWDLYGEDYYDSSPGYDPRGPVSGTSGNYRVLRGGNFLSYENNCRVASRGTDTPLGSGAVGFRVVSIP